MAAISDSPRRRPNTTTPPGLTRAEYGQIGAQRRWGIRIVRLDGLDPEARRAVVVTVEQMRNR